MSFLVVFRRFIRQTKFIDVRCVHKPDRADRIDGDDAARILAAEPIRRKPLESLAGIAVPVDRKRETFLAVLVGKFHFDDPAESAFVRILRRQMRHVRVALVDGYSRLAALDPRIKLVCDRNAVFLGERLAYSLVVRPFAEGEKDALAAFAERMR